MGRRAVVVLLVVLDVDAVIVVVLTGAKPHFLPLLLGFGFLWCRLPFAGHGLLAVRNAALVGGAQNRKRRRKAEAGHEDRQLPRSQLHVLFTSVAG